MPAASPSEELVPPYGFVMARAMEDRSTQFSWSLVMPPKLYEKCSGTFPPDTENNNKCGIHIHEGCNCGERPFDAARGHWYRLTSEDPWPTIRYQVKKVTISGQGDVYYVATGYASLPTTGLSYADISERTVVVHGPVDGGSADLDARSYCAHIEGESDDADC